MKTVVSEKTGLFRQAELSWDAVVAAGYTGRDQKSVKAHVEELKKLGVPAPSQVPTMYWVEPERVSAAEVLWVVGDRSSGEVEVFIARDDRGDLTLSVASDHTDRAIEAVSVAKAKQMCSKVVSPVCWLISDVREHWDELRLRSWVDGVLYQDGKLGQMLHPEKLLELAIADGPIQGGQIALFSGTLPIVTGETVYGSLWRLTLTDPILKREISTEYRVYQLPDRN